MVLHKNGPQLYNGVKTEVSDHLLALAQDRIIPLFPTEGDAAERAAFLKAVKETWEHHTLCMGMIRDILMYMVGFHVVCWTPPLSGSSNKPHTPHSSLHRTASTSKPPTRPSPKSTTWAWTSSATSSSAPPQSPLKSSHPCSN